MAARVAARFGVLELAENYGAPPDKISRWSGDRWYRNFISAGRLIGSEYQLCRNSPHLTSFRAKKLDLPKNAAPTECLLFRVLGSPQKKATAGREDGRQFVRAIGRSAAVALLASVTTRIASPTPGPILCRRSVTAGASTRSWRRASPKIDLSGSAVRQVRRHPTRWSCRRDPAAGALAREGDCRTEVDPTVGGHMWVILHLLSFKAVVILRQTSPHVGTSSSTA